MCSSDLVYAGGSLVRALLREPRRMESYSDIDLWSLDPRKFDDSYDYIFKYFEDDFDKLRTRLIRMGSLVEEQVEFAFRALLTNNETLANVVIERDDTVDKLDLKIDRQVQRLFALQQPVASDLRLLLAAIHINNELERIGDASLVIARLTYEPGVHHIATETEIGRAHV